MKIRFNIVLGQVSFLRWTSFSVRFIFISLQFYPIVHINVKPHSVYIPALIGCHIRFSLIPYGFLCAVVAHADGGEVRIQNIGAASLRVHPAIDHLLRGGVSRRDILPRGVVPDPGVIQGGKAGGSIRPGVVKERGKFFDPHLGCCADAIVGLEGGKPSIWPPDPLCVEQRQTLPACRCPFDSYIRSATIFSCSSIHLHILRLRIIIHNRAKSNAGVPLHYFFDIILRSQKVSKNRKRFPIRYNAAKNKECK